MGKGGGFLCYSFCQFVCPFSPSYISVPWDPVDMELNVHVLEVSGYIVGDQSVMLSWPWFDVFHPRDGCCIVQEKPDVCEVGVAFKDVCTGRVESSSRCDQF